MSGLQAYHDSQDVNYREPFGAVQCGEQVKLKLEIQSESPVQECSLRLWEKETEKLVSMPLIETAGDGSRTKWVYQVTYDLPDEPGLVWYFFMFASGGKTYFYGNNNEVLGGVGQLAEDQPPGYQITVYRRSPVPAWFKRGVMYQIFVDRFHNGNDNRQVLSPKPKSLLHGDWHDTPFYIKDAQGRVIRWTFFGGNLPGIIKKLPYLAELGITILYLNPVFEAASSHKYDTGDYHKIDPMYGDEQTFARLVREAGNYGISIILDGVFNHTGSDSLYFNKYGNYPGEGAFHSEESPYFRWYRLESRRGKYDCWWGVEDLPNVNELEPSYQDFIFRNEDSVIRRWMDQGVKGWRLDVADELPDEFIKGLKQAVREKDPESVLIGEVWEDASRKISYDRLREYFWGDELDSSMNYPLRKLLLDYILGQAPAAFAVRGVMSLYENYPPENFRAAMNLIGSHDRARILTLLGDAPPEEELPELERERFRLSEEMRSKAVQRLKLLSLLQMTLPGVPCVYYGDEAGLEGYADPYNRGTFPWGREDQGLLLWYQRLIRMRKEYDLFTIGDFRPFHHGENVFGFRISGSGEEVIVYVNRSLGESEMVAGDQDLLISGNSETPNSGTRLPGHSGYGNPAEEVVTLDLLAGTVLPAGSLPGLKPLEGKVIYRRPRIKKSLSRSSGILLHLTSLPSPWGIGDLGEAAGQFVDFLEAANQQYWQILPLNPLGKGHSPYQSPSVFAGNELLISIDYLMQEGLLTEEEIKKALIAIKIKENNPAKVDYALVQSVKRPLLEQAFLRYKAKIKKENDSLLLKEDKENYLSANVYRAFRQENEFWLEDYCLYRVLKKEDNDLAWYDWERPYAGREEAALSLLKDKYRDEMEYHRFLQYTFYWQWKNLKKYANAKGIRIIGDLPIYTASDSSDAWAYAGIFSLDTDGRPKAVAGVPPDYFSETGQLWETPLYNWQALAKEGYLWWLERVRRALNVFDYIRLDHFRGFESYWQVPAGESTAVNGRWSKGPGKRLFECLEEELGNLPFIAEDLGVITPEVNNLKNIFGFPGMKVYQFAAGDGVWEEDLSNTVLYSGTHDNDTLLGWYEKNRGEGQSLAEQREACRGVIAELYAGQAPLVILPLQDILLLDSEARMNTPGTVDGNWEWRLEAEDLTREIEEWLKELAVRNNR